jgi:hypothetical protein
VPTSNYVWQRRCKLKVATLPKRIFFTANSVINDNF